MAHPSTGRSALGLAGWLLLTFAAGAVGAAASTRAAPFYETLVRPAWAPPAWLFGPVWTLLYALMGLAAWLVWRRLGWHGARPALALYVLQLAVNALWSWIFFVGHRGALASFEILVLLVLFLATLRAFQRAVPLAATLLLPTLAWVTFAALLCWRVWRLNPALLG